MLKNILSSLFVTLQEGNNALMIAVTTGAPAPVNLLWQYKIKLNLDYRNKVLARIFTPRNVESLGPFLLEHPVSF